MTDIIAPDGYEFVKTSDGRIMYRKPYEGEWFLTGGYVCQVKEHPYYGNFHILRKLAPDKAPAPVADAGEIRPGEKFCEDALAETCQALQVQLGLAKNRIHELEEQAENREKSWARLNADNTALAKKIVELQKTHDAAAANNLNICRIQARQLLTQLGG